MSLKIVRLSLSLFQMLTCLILMIVLSNLVLAEVDLNKPNLRGYKLKSAKIKQQRASESIVDLASGAKYLHESLFFKDKIVRCSSYAHLFKIIKQQDSIKTNGRNLERIKQNLVEALAITVANEKELYESLFMKELRTTVPKNFLEATKLLETSSFNDEEHAKGAWLDLISCMSNYMQKYGKMSDPAIVEFLRKDERSEALAELEKREADNNLSEVPTTNGIVAYVRQRFSGDTNNDGRTIYGRFMSNKVLDESSKLVASYDDEMTQNLRENWLNKHKFNDHPTDVDEMIKSSAAKSSDFLEDKLNGIKEPMPDYDYSYENNQRNGSEKLSNLSSLPRRSAGEFNESKMDLLESVKRQLDDLAVQQQQQQQQQGSSMLSKIDMSSAMDFLAYFEDLDSANQVLDPTSDLGKRAISFQQEPGNRKLLARVEAAVGKYVRLVSVLAELKMQEDRWSSVDSDLRPKLGELESLLVSFDPAFDVEGLRKELSVWEAKCSEYSAIHQFIKTHPED